ncbi:MAG: hypothetical protein GY816_18590 [Cytophagales bacterium]|nr:hypothetical protein [Cytophagales bacterium]
MEIDQLREYCLSMTGTTEGMKWGENLTFMVGGKIFAVFSLDTTPINASFQVSDEDFETMSERERMKPAPYFAKNIWICVENIGIVSDNEWKEILTNAYEIIKAKLPEKVRENL